ncbi:hypothetical protein [Fluviicola sp.]|jgi:hypothetical protein|uniref:hypothetical protein n=1 Tax=Fluviicola sp. TaxID=1917219 RepID=UPI00282DAD38|nr:hypothetical protein [Fluviicola sp.]MDR0802967.1 hypothetical protein [Fluviicola sp.]
MTSQKTYRIWLKFAISHDYFDAEQCGVILEPDHLTQNLLQKAGILFKQQSPCSWVLIAENEISLELEDSLTFLIKAARAEFYYYTDEVTTTISDCFVADFRKEGIWKILSLPASENRFLNPETEVIDIRLKNQQKHIEFLIFPSQSYLADPLEIREQRGKVLFNPLEESTLPGTDKKLFRIVSSETIPLKKKSAYQFHLWELRKSGDNLLSRLPDFPLIQSLSPFSPKDTLTSYIYL